MNTKKCRNNNLNTQKTIKAALFNGERPTGQKQVIMNTIWLMMKTEKLCVNMEINGWWLIYGREGKRIGTGFNHNLKNKKEKRNKDNDVFSANNCLLF